MERSIGKYRILPKVLGAGSFATCQEVSNSFW